MRLLTILLLQGCVLLPSIIHGQEKKFAPGDRLTPQELEVMMPNAPETGKSITKNARLIILDFWDVNCISCIAAFPEMDSLQKIFGEQIQVILVNRQTKDSTAKFFKKRKKIKIPELPFIYGDTIINRYFPHVGEPYHVWINSTGKVELMSYGHVTNSNTVANYLNAGLLPGNIRTSPIAVKSLFDERWDSSMAYYSYLSHCIENGMVKIRPEKSYATIIAAGCRSITELYQIAFNERDRPYYGFNRAGRTILNAKNSEKYNAPQGYGLYNEWVVENGYNYHLYLPVEKSREKYKFMREDLGRYFNLDAKVVKRTVKSIVLIAIGKTDRLRSTGGEPKDNFEQTGKFSIAVDSLRRYINKPYEGFSRRLEYMIENKFKRPFIDLTSIGGNVDIVISGSTIDSIDLQAWKRELKKYGLALVEREIMLEVLVIKERE